MTADPEEVTYRTVPLAPILIIAGLPTGTTEGLQYRLKSCEGSPIEKAAHVHDERLQAATLATGGQPGAQQHAQQDPTAFWKEKASRSVYPRGRSSSSAVDLSFYNQTGPWDTREQLDIRQTLDPDFMAKKFGHIEKDLGNLPADIPKPGQFGHHAEAT